ncbi:MAG: flippase [Candidatus Pacebacteria bacterium]|nr:flippase [Candidatus Paceibacterota bacterium]
MLRRLKSLILNNKNLKNTVVKNTMWLFLGEIAGRLLKMGLVIYAARILGANDWGIFSYALGLAGLFGIFSDFGLSNLLTRELAKNGANRSQYLSTIFILKLILTFTSVCILLLVAPHISKMPGINSLLPLMAIMLVLDSMRDFGFGLNRAYEKMGREALVKIIMNGSIAIAGIVIIFSLPSVKNVFIIYTLGSLLGCLATFYVIKNHLRGVFKNFSKTLLKPIFDFAWPFAILIFFNTILTNTDILMLGILSTPESVGLYSAAQKLTQFLYLVPALISVAVLPMFSKLVEAGDERFELIFTKIIRLLLLFGFPIVIGGALLSKNILVLIFGGEYASAAATLSIMLFLVLINFPKIIMDNAILAHDQQKKFLKYTLIAVVLNVVLNYLLIPIYGSTGAAVSTLISSLLGMGIVFIQFRKANNFRASFNLGKILISTLLMSVTVVGLKYLGINTIYTVLISIILYTFILYILKDETLQQALP